MSRQEAEFYKVIAEFEIDESPVEWESVVFQINEHTGFTCDYLDLEGVLISVKDVPFKIRIGSFVIEHFGQNKVKTKFLLSETLNSYVDILAKEVLASLTKTGEGPLGTIQFVGVITLI